MIKGTEKDEEQQIKPLKNQNMINGVPADDVMITAFRVKGLGEFYFDKKFGTIDWRSDVGEEISLTPRDWAELANWIPRILKMLNADD